MSMSAVTMSAMLRDRCGSTSSAESSSFASSPAGSFSPSSSFGSSDMSSTDDPRRLRQSNSSRYKTELCRAFEEYGTCKYGEKCQFAHGMAELRSLCRHPKYKTELCRTFHTEGFCPYGKRCHFVHTPKEELVPGEMKLSPLELAPEPLFLDSPYSGTPPSYSGTPPHLPSPPAPRVEYFEPKTVPRKKQQQQQEFYILQQEMAHLQQYRDLNELKRQYLAAASQQVPQLARRQMAPTLGDQWQAAQALRNALDEVANSRLPVFTGLGTA